jgi:DNA-binding beta-propeller fold protein YncE
VDLVDEGAPVATTVVPDPPAGAPAFGPCAVALSTSGARLAVSNRDAKELRFLDVARGAMEALVVPLLGAPYFPAWSADGTKVFVPLRGLDAVALVDPTKGAVVRTKVFDAAACQQTLEAIASADPATLFVVCEGNVGVPGAILTLDATTLEIRARAEVGAAPGRTFLGRGR